MNKKFRQNYRSTLYQIAASAARESEKICKGIIQRADNTQTTCTLYRRMRRMILHGLYTISPNRSHKKRYKIKSLQNSLMPSERYLYICCKLSYLADRQSKILLLCRIYRIPVNTLTDLFAELALAFTLIYYHLSHIQKCKSDLLYQPILQTCQNIVHACEEYAWTGSLPADHRALMRRDIADEFRTVAEGLCEILALTLVLEVNK